MTPRIYLAGPIAGCTNAEANDWRADAGHRLRRMGMQAVSPLRCEPIHGERYGLGYDDPRFGTAKAISSKNWLDVQQCIAMLAYIPRQHVEDVQLVSTDKVGQVGASHSLGTVAEVSWAFALQKPSIVVSEDEYIQKHPVLNACASWILGTFDEAFDVIEGVFSVYSDDARAGQGSL